ncbi:DNA polymerase III subunit gamma/tau [methane-oxidizing endosymbiont of Gigantopelta aegis]|uniref:DNA polymerase III subunit gamma/tau n=1 Tax=methane-oxidizing endosymbiont of Gigantopelta aegis TaxID=2794938 RepID=UPI0018DD581A|nr:DNA polymerase III subunit gamma/tau [methane-oxidizing endosymbiont of Gigantopelta aegis]
MAYQALARKWRPRTFSEIVGQQHVSQSLIHALQHDRLHHAYLFTGTRGVGKTTIARILAKAINCENLTDFNPCGQCAVCQAFDQGRFMDLIEVDAASRTKVEDTRDLLDNVQYAPNQGRYKVYLIDEVHMLSGHSFNALLKTLEEPPEHVKFLLATTDPQKIPVTILSRCLQFNLKRLYPEQIEKQMAFILQQEGIEFENNALALLARVADGSMRDGLSILDQAIAYGNGAVHYQTVLQMLGTVSEQSLNALLEALAANDGLAVLNKVAEMADLTPDFADSLQQLLRMLHRIALTQQIPARTEYEFDPAFIQQMAEQMSPEDVQLFYQIGVMGQKELDLAPDPRTGFEMILLRMLAFKPASSTSTPVSTPPSHNKQTTVAKNVTPKATIPAAKEPQTPPPAQTAHASPAVQPENDWQAMIDAMNLRGMTRELANNCTFDGVDEQYCYLSIEPSHKNLLGGKSEEKLLKALQTYYNRPLKLKIGIEKTDKMTPAKKAQLQQQAEQQAAVEAINNDDNVNALKEEFNARVVTDSIKPIK